ncbi:MAG: cirA 6 [Firmicutes bacterium]|nr:cirA 6 [Bacillota bacterium]
MNYKKLKKKVAVTLAVGTILSAGQVWAAEETGFQLDQLTVTADRIAQTVGTTPSDVSVITAAELEDKGARTLADALSSVPGVTIQSYGSTGQIAIPYILGTDRVVVLIDGKRMNLPQGMSYGYGGVDANTFLLSDNVERIEVVRGGGSVLYGADAVGGVINIITKKGQTDTPTTVSIAGGNDGAGYYNLSTGGQNKNTRWRLAGTQDLNDGQRTNSDYKAKNVSFRLDHDLKNGESLTADYDYYGSHAGLPGSLYWATPSDYGDILRHDWSVNYTKEHADGNRILRYYDHNQVYSTFISPSFYRHENSVRAFEYQDSTKLDTANLLTWGGEWRRDKVTSTAEGNVPHSGTTKAVFLQDRYDLTASSAITVGVRQDDSSIYGAHTLPKIAYLYQANNQTSYFANWGKVFKAPNFDQLYWNDSGMLGNPDLKPETGWTAEVGVKSKLSKATEGTLSLFKRDLQDAIKWRSTDPTDWMAPWQTYNVAHYTATGATASISTKLSPVTTATFGYTYLDSHDQDGNAVGDPRNSFNIGLTIHEGKLSQTISGIYEGQSGASGNQVPSHFIVNTNTIFGTTKNTSIFLTVNNVLNKQYQSVNGYPANSRTFLLGVKQTF